VASFFVGQDYVCRCDLLLCFFFFPKKKLKGNMYVLWSGKWKRSMEWRFFSLQMSSSVI
jgi:hypothetical protein